ncbi:MAG: universal stress protein [Polyangiaceae bacterium]|nr:universal stress protein [Polyangiaceae bacterium]
MERSAVIIAIDLTEYAEPAIALGHAYAETMGASVTVLNVLPDALRHPPVPSRNENELAIDLKTRAKELVRAQVSRTIQSSAYDDSVRIEFGDPEDEIVRVAEELSAKLVVVGAKPRVGSDRVLGHIAERVVRYAHTSVLVARSRHTRRALVATDFTEGSLPAMRFGGLLAEKANVATTLLHVMQPPGNHTLASIAMALGSPWMPVPRGAMDHLKEFGRTTLEGFAKQYHFASFEQVEGDPTECILACAGSLDADLIVLGSHGRTGLRRLVLGSTAENVIRMSNRSVLVTR